VLIRIYLVLTLYFHVLIRRIIRFPDAIKLQSVGNNQQTIFVINHVVCYKIQKTKKIKRFDDLSEQGA